MFSADGLILNYGVRHQPANRRYRLHHGLGVRRRCPAFSIPPSICSKALTRSARLPVIMGKQRPFVHAHISLHECICACILEETCRTPILSLRPNFTVRSRSLPPTVNEWRTIVSVKLRCLFSAPLPFTCHSIYLRVHISFRIAVPKRYVYLF